MLSPMKPKFKRGDLVVADDEEGVWKVVFVTIGYVRIKRGENGLSKLDSQVQLATELAKIDAKLVGMYP